MDGSTPCCENCVENKYFRFYACLLLSKCMRWKTKNVYLLLRLEFEKKFALGYVTCHRYLQWVVHTSQRPRTFYGEFQEKCTMEVLMFYHALAFIKPVLRPEMVRALCNMGAQPGSTIEIMTQKTLMTYIVSYPLCLAPFGVQSDWDVRHIRRGGGATSWAAVACNWLWSNYV